MNSDWVWIVIFILWFGSCQMDKYVELEEKRITCEESKTVEGE